MRLSKIMSKTMTTAPGSRTPDPDDGEARAAPVSADVKSSRYVERELLGRGGMGEVHLRRDDWLGRDVAVKMLGQDRPPTAIARARLLREARVHAQLEHPAIVPVYDLGQDEQGRDYFTMKRVVGRTLKEILERGNFPRNRLLAIFRQVCLAVDYAHARGVAHRDLKPANVMIGDYGEVYVLDWGLAKVLGVGAVVTDRLGGPGETLAGGMLGTPGYMAPEQIDAADAADERADVYALGAMLFELLAGRPLHRGEDARALVESTKRGAPARPSEEAPDRGAPPELDSLCERATVRDPARRDIGARELADAVERFLEGDRDLLARRKLAAAHAELASAAEQDALAEGPLANDARARALREAGRAMALDPENAAGATTLLRLVARPPSSLPDEVREEVDRADLVAMRLRNRKGIVPIALFFLLILSLPLGGDQSWPHLLCILVPLAATLALSAWVFSSSRELSVERFERRTDWVVGLGLLSVAACSVVATSLIVIPTLALAFAVGGAGAARPRRRRRYLVMSLAAFLLPFFVEWTHLAPTLLPGLTFISGGALIPLRAVGLPPLAFRALALVATCASILTPMLTVFPVLDAASELRTQSCLNAWHLRKLVAGGEPPR